MGIFLDNLISFCPTLRTKAIEDSLSQSKIHINGQEFLKDNYIITGSDKKEHHERKIRMF